MSSVASSAAAVPTPPSCNSIDYQIPTEDVACAVANVQGIPDNYTDIAKGCCKDAPVEQYAAKDCGFYCLSIGQAQMNLSSCLIENGVEPGLIFCNSNTTATATGSPSDSASATSSGGSGSSTGGADSQESTGAAPATVPQTVSKAGLGMLAMIVVSAAAGAML
ncbi:hypothetical protein BS50DRAFT_167455 [Corynespora cassiicola Philippines]|uniref:Uncharacterized protein n=1 Tax=Corynespora cassiicola Philippines TaxID=1448308 RepID=A0A2T2P502_CORCC|nr:hypothetical protein BS50DRAFT_167455 [Corynespora cassiicola Philippines]